MISLQKQMVLTGELSAHAIDVYLSHLWRESMLTKVTAYCTDKREPNKFYLKHNDDKGDHILADMHHNITGIIDWEFATTKVREYAFSSPCMMWPVEQSYAGSNQLAPEELEFAAMFDARGRPDLGDCVRNGRKMQRFMCLTLHPGAAVNFEEWVAMFQAERAAWADEDDGDAYGKWKEDALQACSADPGLHALLRRAD
jgi:aminoglycoside phosphotransferase (APT) family kinase protein